MMLAVGACAGRIENRFGSKPPLIAGAAFAASCFGLLIFAHSDPIDIYIATTLLGIGIGLAFAAMANLIVENVRQDQTGVATGMNTVMRSLGGAIGGQVVASLLSSRISPNGLPLESGFTIGFVFCMVALLIAIGVGTLVPARRPEDAMAPELMATPPPVAAAD